MTFICS